MTQLHDHIDIATYFTTKQIARRYKVAADKVLKWIRSGELRAVNVASTRIGRPRFVVSPDELSRFETARTTTVEPAPARAVRPKNARRYY